MSKENKKEISGITNRDLNLNAVKAGMKLIPVVGEAMLQLCFGRGEEARERRLNATLKEVAQILKDRNRGEEAVENVTNNEDFHSFFQAAAEPIKLATNEDKRRRFRDLLFNSMFIPQGDPGWEESMHCLDLLQRIDNVGLYCLAMIEHARRSNRRLGMYNFENKYQWVSVPPEDPNNRQAQYGSIESQEFKYNAILVERAIKFLSEEVCLLSKAQVSFGGTPSLATLYLWPLTPEGQLLVEWSIEDF